MDFASTASMLVFLPDSESPAAIDDFLNNFNVDQFREAATIVGQPHVCNVKLPKFILDDSFAMKTVRSNS